MADTDTITDAPSLESAADQYIVLCGQIVGNGADGFQTIYGWDGEIHADRKAAIAAGWKERDSDDFNIGVIRNGRLASLDWMDESLDEAADSLIEIEEQIDWRDPRDTHEVGQEADGLQQGGDESDFAWLARLRQHFAAPPSEALAQAVAAARAETDWRPIETAPRDGRMIGVPGGCAYWSPRMERWAAGVGESYGRPIEWPVTIWKSLDPPTPAQTDTAPGGRADG